jgi:hypothetical protein
MVIGDTSRAIENYLKSVRLNPGNENGLKVLQGSGINTDSLVRKVSIEDLKLLEGNYRAVNDKNWTIEFRVVNGKLTGNDRGFRFNLVPAGENRFVNPVDGASLEFDATDKSAITLLLFGNKFRKVI